jgi:hypothetical protein
MGRAAPAWPGARPRTQHLPSSMHRHLAPRRNRHRAAGTGLIVIVGCSQIRPMRACVGLSACRARGEPPLARGGPIGRGPSSSAGRSACHRATASPTVTADRRACRFRQGPAPAKKLTPCLLRSDQLYSGGDKARGGSRVQRGDPLSDPLCVAGRSLVAQMRGCRREGLHRHREEPHPRSPSPVATLSGPLVPHHSHGNDAHHPRALLVASSAERCGPDAARTGPTG